MISAQNHKLSSDQSDLERLERIYVKKQSKMLLIVTALIVHSVISVSSTNVLTPSSSLSSSFVSSTSAKSQSLNDDAIKIDAFKNKEILEKHIVPDLSSLAKLSEKKFESLMNLLTVRNALNDGSLTLSKGESFQSVFFSLLSNPVSHLSQTAEYQLNGS